MSYYFGSTSGLFAQTPSIPAALQEPQGGGRSIQQRLPSTLGFGIGVISGDASFGYEVLSLTTQYSHRLSSVTELEFSLGYQSTSTMLSPKPASILFASTAWNGDVSVLTHPFAGWYNLRLGGGFSLRRQVGNYQLTQTTVTSTGQPQTTREVAYQQAMDVGASLKVDYLLFTNERVEAYIRGQGSIYAVPLSGAKNQGPRNAPGGAASLQLCFRACF